MILSIRTNRLIENSYSRVSWGDPGIVKSKYKPDVVIPARAGVILSILVLKEQK